MNLEYKQSKRNFAHIIVSFKTIFRYNFSLMGIIFTIIAITISQKYGFLRCRYFFSPEDLLTTPKPREYIQPFSTSHLMLLQSVYSTSGFHPETCDSTSLSQKQTFLPLFEWWRSSRNCKTPRHYQGAQTSICENWSFRGWNQNRKNKPLPIVFLYQNSFSFL